MSDAMIRNTAICCCDEARPTLSYSRLPSRSRSFLPGRRPDSFNAFRSRKSELAVRAAQLVLGPTTQSVQDLGVRPQQE